MLDPMPTPTPDDSPIEPTEPSSVPPPEAAAGAEPPSGARSGAPPTSSGEHGRGPEGEPHPGHPSRRTSDRDPASSAAAGRTADQRHDHRAEAGGDGSLERVSEPPAGSGRRATDGVERRERGRPPDRMLNLLLLAAERDIRVGLTVNVGGVVVSGTLIGTLAYCRALADQFASAAGGTEMDETFADSFRDLVDDAVGVAGGDRRNPPDAVAYQQAVGFLHLADARYVGGTGLMPMGRHGVLWRCPVCDVSGWSLGDLTPR